MTFTRAGREERAVSIDISLSGAFIHTSVPVPPGEALTLTWEPRQGGAAVRFTGAVCRRIAAHDPTEAPGLGIQWDRAWTAGTVEHLRAVLKDLFQVGVRVKPARQGGAIWFASRWQRADHARGDALRLDAQGLDGLGQRTIPRAAVGDELTCFRRGQQSTAEIAAIEAASIQLHAPDAQVDLGDVLVCFHRPSSEPAAALSRAVAIVARRDRDPSRLTLQVLRVDLSQDGAADPAPRTEAPSVLN